MKFYLFLTALVVLCWTPHQATAGYACPNTNPVVECSRNSAMFCFRFCANAIGDQRPSSTSYVCPGTTIKCPHNNPTTCLVYCNNLDKKTGRS